MPYKEQRHAVVPEVPEDPPEPDSILDDGSEAGSSDDEEEMATVSTRQSAPDPPPNPDPDNPGPDNAGTTLADTPARMPQDPPPQPPPVPAPRRSTRDRQPPAWQSSGDFIMDPCIACLVALLKVDNIDCSMVTRQILELIVQSQGRLSSDRGTVARVVWGNVDLGCALVNNV